MVIDQVVHSLDQIGIAVFVISGSLLAAKLKMDITSFVFLGLAAGIGGGTIRDLLLGRDPVFWVAEPYYLILCVSVACTTFFIAHWLQRVSKLLLWFDALGMAIFSVIGTQIALEAGVANSVAILMGVITACFGGLVRDILAQMPSILFQKSIYVTAALLGATSFVYLTKFLLISPSYALMISFLLAFILRGLAIIFNLRLSSYKWIDKTE